MQRPPNFSAKHVDGKRAYESARKGIDIVIPEVSITIHEFEITRVELPEVDFRIRCSKGTYIRTIAHDLGKKLGSGSHLIALRRTASLPFHIKDALTLEQLLERLQGLIKMTA